MIKLNKIYIDNVNELCDWLKENYGKNESLWLVTWKKGSGKSYISYDEIVDELICFGWVDSLPRKLDDKRTMLRISPRNPKSNWSNVNKERVERLTKSGKMQAPGLRMVETAKSNGSWDFLNDVENLNIPSDLGEALKKNEKAKYYFERFPDSSKRGILEWIKNAKQDSTRQRRIEETVTKAAKNIKANHPKGRDSGPIEK
jgi:uncharacterized protein YdeI (YjbR/CyaY-like superfamily)